MSLAEEIRGQNGQNVLAIIKTELPDCDVAEF